MQHPGPQAFLQALAPGQRQALFALDAQAQQEPPAGWLAWRCGSQHLGLLSQERAAWLAHHLADCETSPQAHVWQAETRDASSRSEALQSALQCARDQGLLSGWRNERFSFWHSDCQQPNLQHPPLLSVERAGFRFLGMPSHAVHVNGFLDDGRLWCARRAHTKATDPGMLDNITAGGLPSGETVHSCLRRELAEEAGLFAVPDPALQAAGCVRTARREPQGWHDEFVHVFNLRLGRDFVPINQDGEVAEFMCLSPQQVLSELLAGAFTVDAAQTLIQGLRA